MSLPDPDTFCQYLSIRLDKIAQNLQNVVQLVNNRTAFSNTSKVVVLNGLIVYMLSEKKRFEPL